MLSNETKINRFSTVLNLDISAIWQLKIDHGKRKLKHKLGNTERAKRKSIKKYIIDALQHKS